ncbi:Protein CYSTEINE-RICH TRANSMEMBRANE MODULE 12 [Cardamine amara subsp. amara]|uniref:Protein CYSTEINE-RICH TRANSMEMBRANE MODULE 12 n=1 Tax=Cardamine amara subsp. amara TaxID=228776 RepID=A0ABD1AP49_CARAN
MMHKDMGDQNPPPGYPAVEEVYEQPGQDKQKKKKKPRFFETKQKGDRGFIEGCLFALCCCWICEMCF